ncbi:MAG: tRNA 2-thiouridine(34) synthase MnmA [bacterium]
MKNKLKIAVGMSGGVDSSVTALLLVKAGYDVTGVFMKNWTKSKVSPYCSEEADRKDAIRVATQLNIPFQVWDFEQEYKKRVMDVFFKEYQAGRTPNPDILCNQEIKFGLFLKRAIKQGFDKIATGHYARIKKDAAGQYHLLKAKDLNKDQSYFLLALNQKSLARSIFPIGRLIKPEVRKIAKKAKLKTADKKDSQGICFVGPVNVGKFLKTRLKEHPGEIVNQDGQVLGRHPGLAFVTIGQRHGLNIGGAGIPYYVAAKDYKKNRIIVGQGNRNPLLFSKWLTVAKPHWVVKQPRLPAKCQARVRYRQPVRNCVINPSQPPLRKGRSDEIKIVFSKPQRAVTSGQYVVIYKGQELIGGGVIEQTEVTELIS